MLHKDELFHDKVELLQLYFPEYLETALGELLCSCQGDVTATRTLLEGPKPVKRHGLHQTSLVRHVKRKRCNDITDKHDHASVSNTKDARTASLSLTRVSHASNTSNKSNLSSTTKNSLSQSKKHFSTIITLNTVEDVERHLGTYVTLHQKFFPPDVADLLLEDVLKHKNLFKCHDFHLFGNQCVLNHGYAGFSKIEEVIPDLVYNGLQVLKTTAYPKSFLDAVALIDDYINDTVIPNTKRLPFQRTDRWSGTYCAANLYEKLLSNLQWHSDRLSHIGPHNFIASVSLGSTRIFRIRSNRIRDAPIYQIPLAHNALLVMKPGCQEEFKHCVNPIPKALEPHPKVGTMRFGLTFRYYADDFLNNIPKCHCNMGMTLRRSFKNESTKGRYFWLCENKYQNKDCGCFYWADFSNKECHFVANDTKSISTWIADDDMGMEKEQKSN